MSFYAILWSRGRWVPPLALDSHTSAENGTCGEVASEPRAIVRDSDAGQGLFAGPRDSSLMSEKSNAYCERVEELAAALVVLAGATEYGLELTPEGATVIAGLIAAGAIALDKGVDHFFE